MREGYEKPPMRPTSEIMATLLDVDGYESESEFIQWFDRSLRVITGLRKSIGKSLSG